MRRAVDILSEAPNELLNCISPARYVGGEFNPKAKSNALLQTVFVFPDLYEIGMSNNALKIIYNRINELDDVSCDRAFAPAPDFEALLNKKNIPLYALETGLVLREADLLLWTLSYELCATTILAMLKTSQIPLHASQRGTDSPILIAGGPCVSNPLPFSPFFDAFLDRRGGRNNARRQAGKRRLWKLFRASLRITGSKKTRGRTQRAA
ncbi:MAG: hypothetical protein Pg6A_17190 [Termitinemataceae bacterium]|nr:MAG: hypothetical protein Pg6A_17190 [Termitinemataceae bacterium]